MNTPTRALVIVAMTALVSCTSPTMPSSPATGLSATEREPLRMYATSSVLPLLSDLTEAYSSSNPIRIETGSQNYRTLMTRLMRGEIPYFISNHLPADSPLWAAPIAQDGIAVITHPDTSIDSLNLDQLRDLFQGRVENWQILNGNDADVIVFSREDGSGTRLKFEVLVMGERQTTRAARIASSSAGMVDAVASTPGAIGYVSSALVDGRVNVLAVDGILPVPQTITDNQYPLRSTVYVVGTDEPEGAYRDFIGWMQSPAGQSVIGRRYGTLLGVDE